jgi:hypothetical protein
MSKQEEAEALKEILTGEWSVKSDDYEHRIVLEEDDPDAIGECVIATCGQEQIEIANLIAAAPRLLRSVDALLGIVVDAILHGMPITKAVADARNEAVTTLQALESESQ